MSAGIKSTVDELLAAQPATAASDQVDMFDPDEFEANAPMPVTPAKRAGSGRPKGARNKSTEEMRRYILARYKHPLIALMEIASRTPADLARELELYDYQYFEGAEVAKHLATGEAFKRQLEALTAALPYLAQKMPIAVEQKGDQRGLLVLGDFNITKVVAGDLPVADDVDDAVAMIDVSPLGGGPP